MTPEQFVYWLSGVLTAARSNDRMNKDEFIFLKQIEDTIKQVRITQNSGDIVACFTGDSP